MININLLNLWASGLKDKQMIKSRNIQVDVLKGILIVFVILGHASKLPYFDWFHMSIFFMISGYLIKVPEKGQERRWIGKRASVLLIPYLAYYFLILLLKYHTVSLGDIKSVLLSGKNLVGIFGVWWFPVCLLISSVLLVFLVNYWSDKWLLWIVSGMYTGAILISNIVKASESAVLFYVPWNLDVCMLAVPYMVLGYFYKKNEASIKVKFIKRNSILLYSIIFMLFFLVLDILEIYQYNFKMKYSEYTNFVLPIIVPLAMFVILYRIVEWIAEKRWGIAISSLGKISIVLMYIHNFVIEKVKQYVNLKSEVLECLIILGICLVVGYLWTRFCNISKILQMLFVTGKVDVKER